MASYLGKISAIVSANTAGYVRGLNEAATQTRAFAQTVQNDINRASREADRSLKSILTPLQQFQRSLNAAVSERLAFKGVDGIVTGIGQLQTKLRELQRQGSRTVDVALNISGRATVDQLIEDLDVLDDRKVQAVIEAVNTESINRAKAQLEQLYSVANEIAKPLSAAARQFEQLGLSVQASFIPALNIAQIAVQELEAKIREGGRVSQDEFDRVARVVDRTTAAVRRLADAQDLVNSLPTGQELRFRNPQVSQTLTSARQSVERAASLPASTIESAGVASIVTQIQQASQYALELQTRVESLEAQGLVDDAASATRQLENATEVVRRLKSQLDSIGNVQAASGRLNILEDLSDPPTAATRLPQGFLQDRAERTARQEIGAGVDPAIRQFRQLASQVQSVRSQIDSLPATIGSEFVPRLREAEQAFVRLRTSGRATAEEIENASNEVQQLAAQVRRVSQTQGIASFADGLDDTALRGAIGNLQALQQILNRVGATAGSDGARQFDRLRAAIQRATRDGTVGSEAFQRELKQITQDAAAAAAATGKIGRSAAFREIQRGGDIARGGFDKLSLATQQAAFAIDDFFSATGDFTQKIRAVQNNVTQLAFILGGTTGLFIGLGTALVAQAAVGLFKWAQGSVDAEDKTQALNDALARQKSLVEELKQAFDSLGDSLTRGIFDEATERARALESQIDSILKKSREQLNEQAVSLDPVVQRERQVQAARQRQLDQTTDIPTRISLQRDIDQSRERERRAAEEAAARSFDPLAAQQSLRDLLVDIGRGRSLDRSNQRQGGLPLSDAERERIQRSRQRVDDFQGAADAFSRRDILTAERNALLDRRATPNIGQNERAAVDRALIVVESLLGDLERPLEEARVKLRVSLLQSSDGIRESLERSSSVLQDSLGGFGPLAAEQRVLAAEFKRITSELAAGATAGVDGVLGTDDDIALTREATEARKEELQRIRELVDGNLSAVRSTEAFSNALDRLAGDLADTVLGEAQSAEQQARRDVNRLQAELNTLPADATPRERLDATARLRDAQQRQAELAASADDIAARRRQLAGRQAFEVEQFQQQARAGALGNDLQRQIRARDAIQGRIDAGQNVASDERKRLAELTASIADAFENSLAGVQLAAEADALDVRRQEVDAGFQRAQQQAEERQRSVDSGLELIRSPEQTAAQRGLDQFNEAINGALSLVANELNSIAPNLPQLDDGLISLQELGTLFNQFPNQIGGIREQFLANLQQARDNITGNISAQIAQFDVERSRPSRQALQAQDINTQQGRAELNRLLRGDDANRDQPILQGIKEQTAILKLIDQRIDEVNRVVGVAGA